MMLMKFMLSKELTNIKVMVIRQLKFVVDSITSIAALKQLFVSRLPVLGLYMMMMLNTRK